MILSSVMKWATWHRDRGTKKKNLSSRWESSPCPPKHRVGAQELVEREAIKLSSSVTLVLNNDTWMKMANFQPGNEMWERKIDQPDAPCLCHIDHFTFFSVSILIHLSVHVYISFTLFDFTSFCALFKNKAVFAFLDETHYLKWV